MFTDYDRTEVVSNLYAIRRTIEKNSFDCREKSLALTKLDEACMWYKSIPVVLKENKEN